MNEMTNNHQMPEALNADNSLENIEYTNTRVVKLNRLILQKNNIFAYDKSNHISSVFDLLRTEVLRKMDEKGWRTLAVVSPTPESGKTFVSINLAMSIAHQPERSVILVDFDLRRPKVANYLGLNVEKSLNDFFVFGEPLSEVIVNPGLPRIVVLPTNKPVANSSELLSSSKVEKMISDLRNRYQSRIVIFDLPPILNVDDARVVIPQVDCVLAVISNGINTQDEIQQMKRMIPSDKLLGFAFNKAEDQISSYYY